MPRFIQLRVKNDMYQVEDVQRQPYLNKLEEKGVVAVVNLEKHFDWLLEVAKKWSRNDKAMVNAQICGMQVKMPHTIDEFRCSPLSKYITSCCLPRLKDLFVVVNCVVSKKEYQLYYLNCFEEGNKTSKYGIAVTIANGVAIPKVINNAGKEIMERLFIQQLASVIAVALMSSKIFVNVTHYTVFDEWTGTTGKSTVHIEPFSVLNKICLVQ